MKTIAKQLGLPENATEDQILAAITKNNGDKFLKLTLGLSETATDREVKKAASLLNLEVVEGKLVAKKAATVKNDDLDDISNDADASKGLKALKKAHDSLKADHDDLRNCHNELADRCDAMEKTMNKFKKAAVDDRISNKIHSLVTTGRVENKAEAIDKAKERLEKDFDLASELYDAMPAKAVKLSSPGAINNLINKAAGETTGNKATVDQALAIADEETKDMLGNPIDLTKAKRPTINSAKEELKNKATNETVKENIDLAKLSDMILKKLS